MVEPLTREQHRARHLELHRALDELLADFLQHQPLGEGLPSTTPISKLMTWSHEQTLNPTEPKQ